ncbi:hypothetical protein B5X24_HaOG207370 [Helicoverpa armigera]|uniref:XK-related protein n=1 Tax=Helicoverpa armigera TaxID=29058 RepID=A0A2W1BK33_HELAM|nr:hypothetical protein B5X24_HaOG207370 [Helicoverpa armigera]
MAEFLPLCDVLFNVISLAGYFCDVVFDVVMGYALLERGYKGTFAAAISIVITSLLISQVLSLRWYLHVWWAGEGRKGRPPWLPILLHCLQLGVLWRYARLLVPVELRRVKHQVRDLCMLRLVHAFCEAAPMLLLQLHILFKDANREPVSDLAVTPEPSIDEPSENKAFAELNVISASLSLFSVCWALASFSKNVRLQNVHRLVLTWLGVIFQFLWRLGTISARICALTVYALVYEYWVFLVIGLHWLSMFLWLISPKNVFHGERISRPRKAYLSALIAFVYVFAYVNLQELNHRQKMVTFYCVMCVENWLLVVAWWWSGRARRPAPTAAAAAAAFLAGLAFMLIYYRYFHVRRLGYMLGEHQQGTNSTNTSSQNKDCKQSNQADNPTIPGVFNCRFSNPVSNSAGNARKKKKPTSFVPPPAAPAAAFWRRPLPAAHNHHVTFYCVMCVENWLLVVAWWWSGRARRPAPTAAAAAAAFLAGLAFMLIYYRYFHVRRLGYMLGEHQQGTNSTNTSSQNKDCKQSNQADNPTIPGVFNCRFSNPVSNSAGNARKKKKPTSFVPPPAAPAAAFWRRPLPAAHNHHGGSSENEGSSVGSRVNIQQKLQEKKQKQLAELRVIEEEIKQGKLAKTTPVAAEEIYSSLQRQPIPRAKTHAEPAWPNLDPTHSYQNYPVCNIYPTYTEIKPDFTPEAPDITDPLKIRRLPNRYDNTRTFYENPANIRNDVTRTPLRSPNYLALENRTYETNCATVLNNSPRNYENNYEGLEKRLGNSLYSEEREGYGGYCEGNGECGYGAQCARGRRADHLRRLQRCRTPEILLAPHYLEGCSRHLCCHWGPPYTNRKKEEGGGSSGEESSPDGPTRETPRPPSDIDSQRLGNSLYSEEREGYGGYCEGNGECGYGAQCARGRRADHLRRLQRCRTPEILLAPHYLEGCSRHLCCHWGPPYTNRKKEEGGGSSGEESSPDGPTRETPRPPSDIDSQISLPRSYTLPREFRYWRRRPRLRDAHVPSNNSSDGDVDSADDNDSSHRSNCSAASQLQSPTYEYYRHERHDDYVCARTRRPHAPRKQPAKPETKL